MPPASGTGRHQNTISLRSLPAANLCQQWTSDDPCWPSSAGVLCVAPARRAPTSALAAAPQIVECFLFEVFGNPTVLFCFSLIAFIVFRPSLGSANGFAVVLANRAEMTVAPDKLLDEPGVLGTAARELAADCRHLLRQNQIRPIMFGSRNRTDRLDPGYQTGRGRSSSHGFERVRTAGVQRENVTEAALHRKCNACKQSCCDAE